MWIRTDKGEIYKVLEQNDKRTLVVSKDKNYEAKYLWDKIKKQGDNLTNVLQDNDIIVDIYDNELFIREIKREFNRRNIGKHLNYHTFESYIEMKIDEGCEIITREQYMPLAQEIKG